VEVAGVETGPPHDLVDLSKLGNGELAGAECRRERRILQLRAGALEAVGQDPVVVEGQAGRVGEQVDDRLAEIGLAVEALAQAAGKR
jgi:hypothetical protein